jgi:hypothetical protein
MIELGEYDNSKHIAETNAMIKMIERQVARLDDTVTGLALEVAKLQEYDEHVNLTMPDPDSDAGDAFVRQELLSMYECCDGRDATALEYVIRLVSTPAQWQEFYRVNDLKNAFAIGE